MIPQYEDFNHLSIDALLKMLQIKYALLLKIEVLEMQEQNKERDKELEDHKTQLKQVEEIIETNKNRMKESLKN